jgi:formylglycine-generating enzyme required for sulfatase activity
MLGNVSEWCSDFYNEDEYARCRAGVSDPKGPPTGTECVFRGGDWGRGISSFCRASDRNRDDPGGRGYYVGFRAAKSP